MMIRSPEEVSVRGESHVDVVVGHFIFDARRNAEGFLDGWYVEIFLNG